VVVTGAAGNLGQAVAAVFAAAGERLALIDVNAEALAARYASAAEGLMLAPANLLDQESTNLAIQSVIDRWQRVDVLCNLAGGFRMGEPVHETSTATWDFLLNINVGTVLNASRAVVPHMRDRGAGKVINVAAYGALRGAALMGAYSASKSAVIRLTEAMSAELRPYGINVNCVLPTTIDTPENRRAMPDADPSQWVSRQALADVIAFLASDSARGVHGAAIPVTGLE
jgi:NAD(P)-dependent dehydrogenase (short-subunit alcohol dehydrogenase family)